MCCGASRSRIRANGLAVASGLAVTRQVRFSNAVIFNDKSRGCLKQYDNENVRCSDPDRWAPTLSRASRHENRLESSALREDVPPQYNSRGDRTPKAPIRKIPSETTIALLQQFESKPKKLRGGVRTHQCFTYQGKAEADIDKILEQSLLGRVVDPILN
mmetsp:Transcript_11605/g.27918  ORF Transcript_11605/g.27918 Transcript_11605/m.27918 type:complete len:159 (+) Transcript_11605:128-604(+)